MAQSSRKNDVHTIFPTRSHASSSARARTHVRQLPAKRATGLALLNEKTPRGRQGCLACGWLYGDSFAEGAPFSLKRGAHVSVMVCESESRDDAFCRVVGDRHHMD